jgi:hypothetical protein
MGADTVPSSLHHAYRTAVLRHQETAVRQKRQRPRSIQTFRHDLRLKRRRRRRQRSFRLPRKRRLRFGRLRQQYSDRGDDEKRGSLHPVLGHVWSPLFSVGPTVQFPSVHRFAAFLLLAGPPTPSIFTVADFQTSQSPPWQRRGGRDINKNVAKPPLLERTGWFVPTTD